jgi:transposase
MAPGKKNAARLGAHLLFVDESGFLLVPNVCKTWAPRGQTPLLHHMYRRDRISVIGAISVSPVRRRLNHYYRLHFSNIRRGDVAVFLRQVLRHIRGPVIVLWDSGSIHEGDPIRELCRSVRRLRLEHFPVYAPELNPEEGVWNHAKRRLANGSPRDLVELVHDLMKTLDTLRRSPRKLRGCVEGSDLPPFLP